MMVSSEQILNIGGNRKPRQEAQQGEAKSDLRLGFLRAI